jgi:hypothetical protein
MQIYISLSLIMLLIFGCSTIDPHENFMNSLNSLIGKKWTELPRYQFPSEKDLISKKILPNGNLEKKYKALRTCVPVFEINPKSDIIVGAGFEGKESDCVINP